MFSKVISFISGSVLTFSVMNYAYGLNFNEHFKKINKEIENSETIGDIVL